MKFCQTKIVFLQAEEETKSIQRSEGDRWHAGIGRRSKTEIWGWEEEEGGLGGDGGGTQHVPPKAKTESICSFLIRSSGENIPLLGGAPSQNPPHSKQRQALVAPPRLSSLPLLSWPCELTCRQPNPS